MHTHQNFHNKYPRESDEVSFLRIGRKPVSVVGLVLSVRGDPSLLSECVLVGGRTDVPIPFLPEDSWERTTEATFVAIMGEVERAASFAHYTHLPSTTDVESLPTIVDKVWPRLLLDVKFRTGLTPEQQLTAQYTSIRLDVWTREDHEEADTIPVRVRYTSTTPYIVISRLFTPLHLDILQVSFSAAGDGDGDGGDDDGPGTALEAVALRVGVETYGWEQNKTGVYPEFTIASKMVTVPEVQQVYQLTPFTETDSGWELADTTPFQPGQHVNVQVVFKETPRPKTFHLDFWVRKRLQDDDADDVDTTPFSFGLDDWEGLGSVTDLMRFGPVASLFEQ